MAETSLRLGGTEVARHDREAALARSGTSTPLRRDLGRAPAVDAPRRRATDGSAGLGIAESAPRNDALRRDATYRRMLAAADVLAFAAALALTGAVFSFEILSPLTVVALPLIVLAAKAMGLYDRDELVMHKTTLNEAPSLFHLTTLVTLVLAVAPAPPQAGADPATLLVLWPLLFGSTLVARVTARRIARATTPRERCVFVGRVEDADRVKRALRCHPELHADLVATIPFGRVSARGEDAAQLGENLARRDFHRVIVTHNANGTAEMLETIRLFKSRGIKVSVLPGLLEVLGSAVEFDDIAGSTLLGVRSYGLSRSSRMLKRAMDTVLAAIGLVLFAPALALIALAIKRDSPGPVFFRQTRVGRGGRHFEILKFRTMAPDADARRSDLQARNETNGVFKLAFDPRVTRVGKFLRSASLDELPQLINVVRGEMSLVGPRPLVVDEDSQVIGWHRGRLDLTPGMTGVWQTLASTRVPLEEMVALDYLYIVDWSLWSDVQILLRTIPHVLERRGL